jgi:hypothetical protein
VTNSSDDDKNTRAIEKLRSWKEISKSAAHTIDPSPDDYATELELFEQGEIDKALWAKHLVEMRGNEEEAKWNYIKERVTTAPVRRAELEKLEKQRVEALTAAEKARLKAEEEARRKAEEEAIKKANEEEARRNAEEEARRKAEEEEFKRKAAESWSKRAELNRERAEAHTARLRKVMNVGGSSDQKTEISPEKVKVSERKSDVKSTPGDRVKQASVEKEVKPVQYEPTIGSDMVKSGLGYTGLFIVAILLALVRLGFILDDAPSERIADQEQALESRAYDLLQRSQEQFYGVTGSVDEKAAETSASLALSRLENIDSDYANYLRDSIRSWLVNILSCASSPLVRDLDGAKEIKRQISDLSAGNAKADFFWDVYWGEAFPKGSLDKSAYLEWRNEADRIIAEWDLNDQSNAVLISALEHEAETDTTSAYVLAQFYECRAQNREFELASDWYVRALENAKRTQGSSDPVDEDSVEMIRSRLERLRKVVSATYLQ